MAPVGSGDKLPARTTGVEETQRWKGGLGGEQESRRVGGASSFKDLDEGP